MKINFVFYSFLCCFVLLLENARAQAPTREFALKAESPKFWELIDRVSHPHQSMKSIMAPSRRSRKPTSWPKFGAVTLL